MGTWSHEPFGNDTANDWAYGLEENQDFSLVDEALQRVIDTGDEYLDADVAAEAVAAAEVIAKALGRGTQSDVYTEKVDSWLASSAPELEPGLATKAQSALLRVLGQDSELRELWEEGGSSFSGNAQSIHCDRPLPAEVRTAFRALSGTGRRWNDAATRGCRTARCSRTHPVPR
uniref:DUF4259 domain-containing protein n=1 Tax=Lysobacter firmicutimachus TaxID=1792846 RepID=UPI003F4DB3B7